MASKVISKKIYINIKPYLAENHKAANGLFDRVYFRKIIKLDLFTI